MIGRTRVWLHGLLRQPFARHVAMLAGANALAQAVVLLIAPVITRLYTPAEMGLAAVYAGVLAVLAVIVAARYEVTVPIADRDETAANLLLLSLILVGIHTLVVAVAVWVASGSEMSWGTLEGLRRYAWLLPFGLLGTGLHQVLSAWAVRRKAFKHIARTRLSRSIGQALAQVGLGLAIAGVGGLIVGHVLGAMLGTATLLVVAWQNDRETLRKATIQGVLQAASAHRRAAIYLLPSGLLNSIGLYLPPLLLITLYGPSVGGWFALTDRCIKIPMAIVSSAISQVYFAEASMLADDPSALRRLYWATKMRLLGMAAVPTVLIVVAGPWAFEAAFGGAWHKAGVYAQLLAPMYLVQFAVSPVSSTLIILRQEVTDLIWTICRLALSVSAPLLAHRAHYSDTVAVALFSGTMFVAYLAVPILCGRALSRNARNRRQSSQWPMPT